MGGRGTTREGEGRGGAPGWRRGAPEGRRQRGGGGGERFQSPLPHSLCSPTTLPRSPAALGAGLAAHSFQCRQPGLSRGLGGARVRSPRAALRAAAAQSPEAAGRYGSAARAPDGHCVQSACKLACSEAYLERGFICRASYRMGSEHRA